MPKNAFYIYKTGVVQTVEKRICQFKTRFTFENISSFTHNSAMKGGIFMYTHLEKHIIQKNREIYLTHYDASHDLVKIERYFDWEIVENLMKPYYHSTIGRPAYPPITLVKILIIQHLEGFRSVRFTCKQISQHFTYRWFLGVSIYDKIPDHSTISKFLSCRLGGVDVWQELFDQIISLIHLQGYLAHETWVADETEFKANANKNKRNRYMKEVLIEEDLEMLEKVNQERIKHGKKLLPESGPKIVMKKVIESPVDEDARLCVKHEKRGRFAYYEHRIVDSLHNFILCSTVTPANVPGHRILPIQLDKLKELFGVCCKEIALDAGYYNIRMARELEKRTIFAYIAYRYRRGKQDKNCRNYHFKKVTDDLYAAPCGLAFRYSTTTRQGYSEFKPEKGSCNGCLSQPKTKDGLRVLRISVNEAEHEELRKKRLSPRGKILKLVRPSTIERSFAQSKELHGLRFARYRGVSKVSFQVLMTDMVQNLKKYANIRSLECVGLYLTYQIQPEKYSHN
ncbi:MAG: transposase [Streptococcaceae bacterium]|nr:transposase [Streptococcaceae bacterium]